MKRKYLRDPSYAVPRQTRWYHNRKAAEQSTNSSNLKSSGNPDVHTNHDPDPSHDDDPDPSSDPSSDDDPDSIHDDDPDPTSDPSSDDDTDPNHDDHPDPSSDDSDSEDSGPCSTSDSSSHSVNLRDQDYGEVYNYVAGASRQVQSTPTPGMFPYFLYFHKSMPPNVPM